MTAGPDELGLPDPSSWRRLGGGDICEVFGAVLVDGRRVVVKQTPYPADLEAEGLSALGAAGGPVPQVLAVLPGGADEPDLLVMEEVGGPADWEALGAALADVHRATSADGRFGWPRDNVIGPLPQANTWEEDWPTFYAERRIRPHLRAAALPEGVRFRLEAALDGPLQALLPPSPPASLVHGDLWSGNVVAGGWLIDPAVHHADREYELAFMAVFGGFPQALWDAYHAAWPLDAGFELRRPAYQLHHLLVHVRLFGAGYVGAVRARLDALGW